MERVVIVDRTAEDGATLYFLFLCLLYAGGDYFGEGSRESGAFARIA